MAAEIIKVDPNIIIRVNESFDNGGMPMPFVEEIFLLDCHIAGTHYAKVDEIEDSLKIGQSLYFRREPNNKHDKYAILIHDLAGRKIGYVPKENNLIIARLMDAGKIIFGTLESKKIYGTWLKITMKIFMRDM